MPVLENAKEEKFAQNIVMGMSQRQAYYDAYPNSKNWKPETVDSKACNLKNTDKVLERCEELKKASASTSIMTSKERKEWLSKVIKDKNEHMANRLKALDTLNKMDGDYTNKVELSGSVNNPFEGLTTEELRKLAE